jgi:hypothetical protein
MTRWNMPFGVSLLAIGRKPLTALAPGPAPAPETGRHHLAVAAD